MSAVWELIDSTSYTYRMPVPGGMLYRVGDPVLTRFVSMCFVPMTRDEAIGPDAVLERDASIAKQEGYSR